MVYRLLGLLLKFFFVLLFIGNAKHGNLPSLTLTGRFLEKYFGYLLTGLIHGKRNRAKSTTWWRLLNLCRAATIVI